MFGWKDEESTRFVYPTTAMVAKFMNWSLRKAPAGEMRDIARSLVSSSVRSALKGKKPL